MVSVLWSVSREKVYDIAHKYILSKRVKTRLQKRDWDAPVLDLRQGTAAILIDRANGNFIGKVFLCSQAHWAMEGNRQAYTSGKQYTKKLDATDLSGTRDKKVSPLPGTVELMLKSFVPEKRIDEQEGDGRPILWEVFTRLDDRLIR
jgi:hypothetical protein